MTFTPPTISNYNSSPPPDDGSATTANKVLWSTIKSKLADPIKNYADSLVSAVTSAFGDLFLNTLYTKSTSFVVALSEDGAFYNCTSAVTATLPPAASAGSGFHIMIYNNSTGSVVVDADSAETINGSLTYTMVNRYESVVLVCTGSAWFAVKSDINNIVPSQTSNSGKFLTTDGSVTSWGVALPTGSLLPFAGSAAPTGFLLCYGQAVSRTTYAALFTAISTTYGAGDGSTTFNLPDLRGRVLAGLDNMGGSAANRITSGGSGINGGTLGASGGTETHTLTIAQLASHTHNQRGGTGGGAGTRAETTNASTGTIDSGTATASAGSGAEHQNTQPTLIVNMIIKT